MLSGRQRVDAGRALSLVSFSALVLALSGIYAVMSFTVSRRTREIGIRIALGSKRSRVVLAILRRPLIQLAAGIVFGALLTFAFGSMFGVTVGFSLGLLGYGLVMLGVCLLACVVPARRALKVDAIAALRTESYTPAPLPTFRLAAQPLGRGRRLLFMRLHPFLAVAFVALATSSLPAEAPIVATTGAPELNETSVSGISFAMTEADYQKDAQRLATDTRFIPMRTKPAGLSAKAQFGVAFVLDEKSRSWIIDGDATKGYIFYGDFNGNGDLGDDGPRTFVDEQGKPTLRISQEARSDDGGTHRILMKLQLDQMAKPNGSEKAFALVRYASLRRVGKVAFDLSKPPIVFRLAGPNGLFNLTYGTTSFDFDGNGTYDTEIERYVNSEKYVNVGEATYEFAADKYGDRITLTRLAVRRPDRAILKTGYAAPDFTYTELNGRALKLSDLRGKVVLLDFWGTWCGPCVAGMPELVSLYEKYHSRGFEILGIDAKDTRDQVAAFTKAHHMPWPQTIEGETDPITSRYRVDGWPTAFLVGVDGKFLEANYLGEVQLAAQLAKAFPG